MLCVSADLGVNFNPCCCCVLHTHTHTYTRAYALQFGKKLAEFAAVKGAIARMASRAYAAGER